MANLGSKHAVSPVSISFFTITDQINKLVVDNMDSVTRSKFQGDFIKPPQTFATNLPNIKSSSYTVCAKWSGIIIGSE